MLLTNEKQVLIVGLGLIGGSMAKAIQQYTDCTLYGFDRSGAVVEKAMGEGVISEELTVDKLGPFVVDIDCRGNNLYKNHEAEVDANRKAALAALGIGEDFEYTRLY